MDVEKIRADMAHVRARLEATEPSPLTRRMAWHLARLRRLPYLVEGARRLQRGAGVEDSIKIEGDAPEQLRRDRRPGSGSCDVTGCGARWVGRFAG